MAETEFCLELFFECDAPGDRALDEHPDQAVAAGAGDQPVRLGIGDVELLGDLALGLAAGEIEPGGARRERRFLVDLQI